MAADPGTRAAATRAAPGDARCPRCGGGFHCGRDDAAPCACTTLRLSPATLRDLRARYAGCLCMKCLHVLAATDPAGA